MHFARCSWRTTATLYRRRGAECWTGHARARSECRQLIDDLLAFARFGSKPLRTGVVDIRSLASFAPSRPPCARRRNLPTSPTPKM